ADLAAEGFDPRFTEADLESYRTAGPGSDVVLAEQDRIDRSDHLILVFPVYWWSMPALLKGWIDRVFINGWAFDYTPGSSFDRKLDRLTVHLVPIAGDDAGSFERHGYDSALRTQIEHGIIEYCGATVGSTTFLHESDTRPTEGIGAEVRRVVDGVVAHVTAGASVVHA
ncbi:MAG: NAD(P)H-dependent oxidoreductase, partial [Rhodococcus sp. (in: high G+C Gram-positive bacteria)]